MSNPAVSLITKAPLGNRWVVTFTLTWATYAQAFADKVTAASIGLGYIDEIFPQQPNAAGYDCIWDQVKGTSVGLSLMDEDNTSGIAADATAGANTTVVNCVAYGW